MTRSRWEEVPLACPVCDGPLGERDATLICDEGHSFDLAREGYANLLVAQHRTRGIEGDTLEMLRARRRFLAQEHFEPLRRLLAETVTAELSGSDAAGAARPSASTAPVVLEAGCGEGSYLGAVSEALREQGIDAVAAGTDVSKAAVRLAAKAHPDAAFFVADVNRRIYVSDASIDVLLDVFAPRNPAEFARVVAPGGVLVIVIPADDHLGELRREFGLLQIEEDKEAKVLARLAEGFELAEPTRTDLRDGPLRRGRPRRGADGTEPLARPAARRRGAAPTDGRDRILHRADSASRRIGIATIGE